MSRHTFITGFPGFIAKRLVRKLLTADETLRVTLLVEAGREEEAKAQIERLGGLTGDAGLSERVELVTGDVTSMDVGLSGAEFRALTQSATEIYHLAAVHHLGVDRPTADRVNVAGTRNMLELARATSGLERFVHFSSAYVSGDRSGVVLEDELEEGQGFRNPYEATKHAAEVLVRASASQLPITIIRPSAVVGDSQSGEIDRFEGVYYVGILLAAAPGALSIRLPGDGCAPLNIIPVDFLVDAVYAIVSQPETMQRTYHVVDPNPYPARRVYDLVASHAGKKPPRYGASPNLAKALLRIPGLERIAPISHQFVDYLNHMVFYNSHNLTEALDSTGIVCPKFDSYVGNLVGYAKRYFDRSRTSAAPS